MATVYFTTVVRAGELARAGEVVSLDWSAKKVLERAWAAPIDASVPDDNPRGGRRGGRGLCVTETAVYAGTYNTIECLDRQLAPGPVLTNGVMAGIHEVHMRTPGRLWLTSTTIDAAVEIDLATGAPTAAFWPRDDPRLQEALGLVPLAIDKEADNRALFQSATFQLDQSHLHLNAVMTWRDELHGLFSKDGILVNLERGSVLMRHPLLVRGHNLALVDDHVFVCSTRARQVCEFDLTTAALVRCVDLKQLDGIEALAMDKRSMRPGLGTRLATKLGRTPPVVAVPLFARGLQVRGDLVFVGVSPASVLCIDWPRGRLVDLFQYSDQVTTAIHGLAVV